jgi:microcin C transport system permease protein
MIAYIIRRLLLMVPTILGILMINFLIIQAAPGGPVEQTLARLEGLSTSATATQRIGAGGTGEVAASAPRGETASKYRGAQGLDPEIVAAIERMYGFDRPAHERFLTMLKSYLVFDLGESFFRNRKVVDLIIEKLPVSISLGLWSTLIIYCISIPLGIRKAVRHGSRFDVWSSTAVIIGNAVPVFLFAILLVVLFAGGSYFNWFPCGD